MVNLQEDLDKWLQQRQANSVTTVSRSITERRDLFLASSYMSGS